jgi:hypothetical protein
MQGAGALVAAAAAVGAAPTCSMRIARFDRYFLNLQQPIIKLQLYMHAILSFAEPQCATNTTACM